jgi:hypothetical protein
VLAKYTPNAIHRNPNTYAAKYSWKTRKKLSVPTGTRREIASAFYQLKIGHGYNKAYLSSVTAWDKSCHSYLWQKAAYMRSAG